MQLPLLLCVFEAAAADVLADAAVAGRRGEQEQQYHCGLFQQLL
jgi:hypothetical protein